MLKNELEKNENNFKNDYVIDTLWVMLDFMKFKKLMLAFKNKHVDVDKSVITKNINSSTVKDYIKLLHNDWLTLFEVNDGWRVTHDYGVGRRSYINNQINNLKLLTIKQEINELRKLDLIMKDVPFEKLLPFMKDHKKFMEKMFKDKENDMSKYILEFKVVEEYLDGSARLIYMKQKLPLMTTRDFLMLQ